MGVFVKRKILPLIVGAVLLGGCTSKPVPISETAVMPDLAIQFKDGEAEFNNTPQVTRNLGVNDKFSLVAYASDRVGYDLAYQRFKTISESLKRPGVLYVQHPDRKIELNTVYLYSNQDDLAGRNFNRFVLMPEGHYALGSDEYRQFQKEALRQYVGVQSGSVYQQLKGLGEFYGWVVRYSGEEAPNRELSLSSLELAFVEEQPSAGELKQLISEVLENAEIPHQINTDVKRRVMEISIQ